MNTKTISRTYYFINQVFQKKKLWNKCKLLKLYSADGNHYITKLHIFPFIRLRALCHKTKIKSFHIACHNKTNFPQKF